MWLLSIALLSSAMQRAAASPASGPPPPAAAFGTLPRTSFVELSPDGKLIAWCDQGLEPQHILVYDRIAEKVRGNYIVPKEEKLRSIMWAGDETLLFNASVTQVVAGERLEKYEFFRTFSLDLHSGKALMLLMRGDSREFVTDATLVAWRLAKPNTVIMSTLAYSELDARQQTGTHIAAHRQDSGWVSTLYEVDARTGAGKRIEMGDQFTQDWVVNGNGSAVARSEWYPNKRLFEVLAKRGLGWVEIYRREDGKESGLYGLTSDGKSIALIGPGNDGRAKLLALPLDGSPLRTLVGDPTRDVTDVISSGAGRTPAGVVLGGIEPQTRWLDPVMEHHVRGLEASFPGRTVELYGGDRDGMRWIARVSAPSEPAVYYLVDYSSKRADIVGEEYPALASVKLGEVRPFTYRARDGTEIPAYLTRPPDAEGRPLPLVVMPHGGPEARDDFAFDWWAQFLATRGYLVLQPQFRGSTGFGQSFADAGSRQWGGLMQDDVTDGVKALIDMHLADPHRICIVGGSYGGYAALAGVAFTPGLYACAISVNGVSDLPTMLSYEQQHYGSESDEIAYWQTDIGSPGDPRVAERSPYRAAARVSAPVLLIHSADDTVVPAVQSQMMSSALQRAGRTVKLVILPGDDHWLSRTETRVRTLQEIEAFLHVHL